MLIFCLFVLNSAISASKNDNKKKLDKSEIKTEHLVSAKILYDEIYDINISEGHYRASVELLLIWEDPKTEEFLNKFGDEIIHGKKLDDYLETIWYPEFFVRPLPSWPKFFSGPISRAEKKPSRAEKKKQPIAN